MIQTEKFSRKIEIIEGNKLFLGNILLVKRGCLAVELKNDTIDLIKLTTGTNLSYRLTAGNNICTFVSTVIGFRVNTDRTIVVLSPPRSVDEKERRKYFRMGISTKVAYCLLPYKSEKLILADISNAFYSELNESTTTDISEGGIKIKTREEFMKGQYGLLILYIPAKIAVLGRAIRCEPSTGGRYDTSFEYLSATDSIKKRISDFIIEKSMKGEG